jgi:hypothetical protein
VFGPFASDPTVSRLIDLLAADAERSLAAINTARAAARAAARRLAGGHATCAARPDTIPEPREQPAGTGAPGDTGRTVTP